MKRLGLLLVVVAMTMSQLLAQESTFVKGDKVINVGIGFGGYYTGSYYSSHMPALSGSFEVGVKDGIIDKGSIGVGGYVGFSSAKVSNEWKDSNFIFGVRGSFHYPLVKKLDTYTGMMLGYNIYSGKALGGYSGPEYTYNSSAIAFAWFAGARYYFNPKIAGMAEIGYGISYLTLGVSFKI
jgi:hypothetical protein